MGVVPLRSVPRKLAGCLALAVVLGCALLVPLPHEARGQQADRLEFTRMAAHWAGYGDEGYLDFVRDAQLELVQHGFYGAHYWSLAHTPQFSGYPAHFPVRGLAENREWLRQRNRHLKAAGVKVVGHFNVEFLVGDPSGPDGPRGFFHFYRNLWDESILGPRPVDDPLELLEKDAHGKPLQQDNYKIGGMREYWACLRNPYWQAVLKAWVRHGIDQGLDGFIANYFYRHDCRCEHCEQQFREYLEERFTPRELVEEFSIRDLAKHRFDELSAWHAPDESTALRREMLRFSQISNKRVFDEVFVKYGRSLKPDLIVAQWNHFGDFAQLNSDERCMLPTDLWGTGEDYLWYSAGGTANATDLQQGDLGDVTLAARYFRGAFDDKPFTVGKYENTRIRSAIAELAANGGAPMGFYTRFTDPDAREVLVRYYRFLARHDPLFRASRPYAEGVLVFPRTRVWQGDVEAVDRFRKLGRELLAEHRLFDVVPDDLATADRLAGYQHVWRVTSASGDEESRTIEFSRFGAPATVRVSASRPAGSDRQITLHLVNYDRHEPPRQRGRPSPGGGVQDERPIPTPEIPVDLRLPANARLKRVEMLTPERDGDLALDFRQTAGRATFTVPAFVVYAVIQLEFENDFQAGD